MSTELVAVGNSLTASNGCSKRFLQQIVYLETAESERKQILQRIVFIETF